MGVHVASKIHLSLAIAAAAATEPLEFPERSDDAARGWRTRTWNGEAFFAVQRFEGRPVAVVEAVRPAHAGWLHRVGLRPFSRHRLTAWARAEGVEGLTARTFPSPASPLHQHG